MEILTLGIAHIGVIADSEPYVTPMSYVVDVIASVEDHAGEEAGCHTEVPQGVNRVSARRDDGTG
jgi:nitroimidazol reductase NimA-like FMN-containing flavoprotein (pyridoxamine 5'-phosphate oxidase superfamily)